MGVLAAWGGLQTVLVIAAVIIIIVLIVLMSTRKGADEGPAFDQGEEEADEE